MPHEIVYGICEDKCQVEVYPKQHIDENMCIKNHASASTEYGVATDTAYGHVKVISSVSTADTSAGAALAQTAGYALNQRFNNYYGKSAIDSMLPSDSGWRTLSLASGVTSGLTGRGTPQYRKIGNHVFIRGSVQITPEDSASIIGNIPSGYRPTGYEFSMQPCGGNRIARVFVNPAGDVKLDFMVNLTDGSKFLDNTWLQIAFDYFTD